jgi:pre-mRNA-splicing factor ATP-dependent RNA helicase DHX16
LYHRTYISLQTKVQEKKALEMRAKNESYKLILDDDDEPSRTKKTKKSDSPPKQITSGLIKSEDKKDKRKHIRTKREELEDTEEVKTPTHLISNIISQSKNPPLKSQKPKKQKTTNQNTNENNKKSENSTNDFESVTKTEARKLPKPKVIRFFHFSNFLAQKEEEEMEAKRALSQDDRKTVVPDLRKESRREYLKKRQPQKLDELRLKIADEEYLFKVTLPEILC